MPTSKRGWLEFLFVKYMQYLDHSSFDIVGTSKKLENSRQINVVFTTNAYPLVRFVQHGQSYSTLLYSTLPHHDLPYRRISVS